MLELAIAPRRPLGAISQERTDRAPMAASKPWKHATTWGRPREPWGTPHGYQSPWVRRPVEVRDGDALVLVVDGQAKIWVGQQWHSKDAPSRMKTFYYVEPPQSGALTDTDPVGYLPQGYFFEVMEIFNSPTHCSVRIQQGGYTGWVNVWKKKEDGVNGMEEDIGLMVCYPDGYKQPHGWKASGGWGNDNDWPGNGNGGGGGGASSGGDGGGGNGRSSWGSGGPSGGGRGGGQNHGYGGGRNGGDGRQGGGGHNGGGGYGGRRGGGGYGGGGEGGGYGGGGDSPVGTAGAELSLSVRMGDGRRLRTKVRPGDEVVQVVVEEPLTGRPWKSHDERPWKSHDERQHAPQSQEGQHGPGNTEVTGAALPSPGTAAWPSYQAVQEAVEEEKHSPGGGGGEVTHGQSQEGQRGPGNPEVSGEALASPGTGAAPSLETNAAVEEGQHALESREGEQGPEAKAAQQEEEERRTGAAPSPGPNTAVETEINVAEPDSGVLEVNPWRALAREPASRVSPTAAAREPTKCLPWPCHWGARVHGGDQPSSVSS